MNQAPPLQYAPFKCSSRCNYCQKKFGLFLRRHHCRNCGGSFCDMHSRKCYRKERVCNRCFTNLTTTPPPPPPPAPIVVVPTEPRPKAVAVNPEEIKIKEHLAELEAQAEEEARLENLREQEREAERKIEARQKERKQREDKNKEAKRRAEEEKEKERQKKENDDRMNETLAKLGSSCASNEAKFKKSREALMEKVIKAKKSGNETSARMYANQLAKVEQSAQQIEILKVTGENVEVDLALQHETTAVTNLFTDVADNLQTSSHNQPESTMEKNLEVVQAYSERVKVTINNLAKINQVEGDSTRVEEILALADSQAWNDGNQVSTTTNEHGVPSIKGPRNLKESIDSFNKSRLHSPN